MRWISSIFPVLIGCIVVVIFWNLSQFVLHADDERERSKYKQFMIWSVVGMFLILSFWGIVYAITNSFFGSTENPLLENPRYMDKNGRIF
jgi:formate hydrogenlyase subunit 3/multisubunit Na+/H+ antiporter MnhD subunit